MENGISLSTSRENGSSSRRNRSSLGQSSNGAPPTSFDGSRSSSQNIFIDNVDRIIDNPLAHWEPFKVREYARKFAQDKDLEALTDLFVKAGLILRDPAAWRSVRGLDEAEMKALEADNRPRRHLATSLSDESFFSRTWWRSLKNEAFRPNGFWQQPKQLKSTTITLCVAAVAQGWCQAGSNGANLNWGQSLLPWLSPDGANCDPSSGWAWQFALVNAAPYLSASLVGCWLSDPLSERFMGRRVPIAISAIFILGPAIGSGCCQHWWQLLLCRFLLGLGMGCKAAVVPVFAAEIAPSHLRGSLIMNWQLFDALGIFLGFTANLIASVTGENAWRWQFASAALPALVLLGQIYSSPESPRFLMKQKKYPAAYQALLQLRGEPILTAKELLYTHVQMEEEERLLCLAPRDVESQRSRHCVQPTRWSIYARKLRLIFTTPRTRRAAVAAMVCMIGQQLCGVNVLEFYSSTIYGDVSHTCDEAYRKNPAQHLDPLWLTWGIGLANFLFTFPAYWLIDRKGRRWLLLTTLPFLATFMLAAALAFLIPDGNPALLIVVSIFSYIFMFFYAWGMGPVPFTYAAECFPLEVRMVGMSFSVFTNFLGAGLLALLVPLLTNTRLHHAGLLGMFSAFNVLTFVLVFLFVPETSNASIGVRPEIDLGSLCSMSLEELSYIFGIPARIIMKIHLKVLRCRWDKYVRRKDVEIPGDIYRLPTYNNRELETLEEQEQEHPILNGNSESARR